MRCGSPLRLAGVLVFLCLGGADAVWAQTQRVVVLYDERVELPGLAALDASLVRTLTAGAREPMEIYREPMDLPLRIARLRARTARPSTRQVRGEEDSHRHRGHGAIAGLSPGSRGRAGRRADELIRRNRELFRQHTVEKEPFDVNGVIREVEVLAAPRLQGSHVVLTTSLASGLPDIIGDRIELQQVLLNLMLNAIDATERVDPGARRIEISTSVAVDAMVKVSVADNGVGLGGVDMQRLFSFSYTTKPNGTGIGLSLSRSIVEAHGGQLRAEDNAGGGATFWFTLPVYAPAATMAAAAVGVPTIPLAGRRSGGSSSPASPDQPLP